jgi:hypothetical protein
MFSRSASPWARLAFLATASVLVVVMALLVTPGGLGATPKPPWANSIRELAQEANSPFAPVFGPNYKANQDTTTYGQHEPSLAVSRVDTNTVIAAAKDYREGNVKHVWIYGSTDGGVTWPVQRAMPGVDTTLYPIQSDPVVMARDDGRIYVACLATNNSTSNGAIYITWTDDKGTTWHEPSVRISPNDSFLDDKDWFAIDNNPASPHYHNIYMMYAPGPSFVAEQHSTDGGLTWTPRQQIGSSGTEYTYPVVASDGTVYNFMMKPWGACQTGNVLMTKSTNGGLSWSSESYVATAEQPCSPFRTGDQFRFFSILSAGVDPNTVGPNTTLYVAWTDDRNYMSAGTDIVYVKSTDSGATWSQPRNLALAANRLECPLCDNITPMITVGADSKVHAFWLDRNDHPTPPPSGGLFDSWYSSSTDGGATWETATLVSTQSQNMNVAFPPGSGNAAGDYWGLDVSQDTIYVAWNEAGSQRTMNQQDIYVAKGLMSGGGGGTPTPPPPTSTPPSTNTPPPVPSATNTPLTPLPTATCACLPTRSATVAQPSPTTAEPSATSTQGAGTTATVTATVTASASPTSTTLPGCDPTWQNVASPTTDNLFSVTAPSRTNAWAITSNSILHWDGSTWVVERVVTPTATATPSLEQYNLASVAAYSPTDVWAAGSHTDFGGNVFTFVMHRDATTWTGVSSPQDAPQGGMLAALTDISPVGPGEAYAVGTAFFTMPIVRHCTAPGGCTTVTLPDPGPALYAVAGSSPSDVWVVGGNPTSTTRHYDGTTWSVVAVPDVGNLRDIAVRSSTEAWAVGDNGIVRWDGTTWTQMPGAPTAMRSISALTSSDIWVAGNGIGHWNGATWTQTPGSARAIAAHDSSDVWAVGTGGEILHYTPAQVFTDVPPAHTFYPNVQLLYCLGIISGYPCGSVGDPCDPENRPYFHPDSSLTRGQLAKIVSGAAGFNDPVSGQTYEDVPPGSTFHIWIERLTAHGAIQGYPCGSPGEPCVGPENRPYFRPNALTTRGQISKIVAVSAGYTQEPTTQTFEDVPPGSTFYVWIENLASRGIMIGYPCGGPGEPCIGPDNRPYFRPGNTATRGQTSKIVGNTFFP